MMARAVPFDLVTRLMTLHFVTRQIYAGSGRVGIGENSEIPGYQLSQRADYIHAKVGLQTTFERPIINTRDESHSTDAYRRLHVIVGDANRMEVPQALKLGTTSMLLWLLEHADEAGFDLNAFLDELELSDPVEAIHTVSRDLTLGVNLAAGQRRRNQRMAYPAQTAPSRLPGCRTGRRYRHRRRTRLAGQIHHIHYGDVAAGAHRLRLHPPCRRR